MLAALSSLSLAGIETVIFFSGFVQNYGTDLSLKKKCSVGRKKVVKSLI